MKVQVEALNGAMEMITYYKSRLELAEDCTICLREKLADLHVKDSVRTKECNLLVQENRLLAERIGAMEAALEKTNLLATTNIQLEAIRLEMEKLLREVLSFNASPGHSLYHWKNEVLKAFPHLKTP